ncbi:myb family transcription factor PHL8-like isoform X2 [Salvia miltiorrhiza]|uniref:myb family transcription factor PHL8-like isoform X2 n=1 Tax=Salvia miltiorrhiza TaxID=226208 RepID=UPI0025ACAE30|nr:myb family transcription factor PHL8-like isoform X2 [Salvia miltiorrhiza]
MDVGAPPPVRRRRRPPRRRSQFKATPKSLMRIMAVDGLTLYHLKSHLQKYRMGRSHQNKQQNSGEKTSRHSTNKTTRDSSTTGNLQMTMALQMQMEVQRKLHEQIEVQKDLQLRVEAQGKYLQRVVRKAQETISEYGSCSIEAEHARAQLAELASMVDSVESSLTSSSEASTQRCQLRERSFLSLSLHPEESIDLNCTKSVPKFIDLNS